MKSFIKTLLIIWFFIFGCAFFSHYSLPEIHQINNILTIILSSCFSVLMIIYYSYERKKNSYSKFKYKFTTTMLVIIILLVFQNYLMNHL